MVLLACVWCLFRLVMPPVLLLLLSIPVYGFFSMIFPQWFVWGSWPGGLAGYLAYDLLHYETHHCVVAGRTAYVRELRRYHMKHHFKYPRLGYGVSSVFWDVVFNTAIPEDDGDPGTTGNVDSAALTN